MTQKVRDYKEINEAVKRAESDIPGIRITDLGPLSTPAGSYPFYALNLGPGPEAPFSVYLSGGIHGDEPGGVWAVFEFLRRYPMDPIYKDVHFTVLPCINPTGFELDTRENAGGFDLNRQFRNNSPPPEVDLVKKAIAGRPFDLSLEFHEDVDTPGFYMYELVQKGEPSWGREIISRVSGKKFPVNTNEEIEGLPASGGLIYRSGGRSGERSGGQNNRKNDFHHYIRSREEWPQAFYHFTNGGAHCFTTETPVTLSREERAEIHLCVLDVALGKLWEKKKNLNR